MAKKILAIVMCALLLVGVIGTFSGCDSNDQVPSSSSKTESKNDTSSVTSSETESGTESGGTESTPEVEQTLYGTWVMDFDLTETVERFMSQVYPESVVVADTVTVDYVMNFSKDGKCSVTMNAANIFYDAVLKTVEKHIRSLTSNTTTINLEMAEFKSNYKKENIAKSMNRKMEGTYTLKGDAKSAGTVTMTGEDWGGTFKFSLDGETITIIQVKDGVEADKMVLTKVQD